jgi:hypothetical protein
MLNVAPALPIVAAPATTTPPVGLPNSGAIWPKTKRNDKTAAEAIFNGLEPFPPIVLEAWFMNK